MLAILWLLLFAQSTSFEATFRLSLEALKRNDLAEARAGLEAAAKMRPDQAQVWLALAQTYWKLHEPERAGSAAVEAERIAPHDPLVLHALGIFYSESGNFEKAAECEAEYASKTPNDSGEVLAPFSFT